MHRWWGGALVAVPVLATLALGPSAGDADEVAVASRARPLEEAAGPLGEDDLMGGLEVTDEPVPDPGASPAPSPELPLDDGAAGEPVPYEPGATDDLALYDPEVTETPGWPPPGPAAAPPPPPAPPPAPAPAPAPPARRGLGAFMGGGDADELSDFERFVGSEVTHAGAFVSKKSWDRFRELDWLEEWEDSGYTLSLGVPMLTERDGGSLQDGARGRYDAHFRHLAEQLVAHGQGDAILRLGWEFNGDWYPWAAAEDPRAFAEYWRRIHRVMRSVPGAEGLRFDWNPAIGVADVPEEAYPGDEYVDIIGMDVYDRPKSAEEADPAARWQRMVDQPYGLAWQRDFAAAHRKPTSFPEWATSDRQRGGQKADNPVFIRNMHEWIRSNDVEYHTYFEFDAVDERGAQLMDGRNPRAAETFKKLF